ncbi:MAG: Holliday junction DNA helicase RuvA [Desulfobacterales bacterium]|nr:Holliday junction DNA helicase RuvA [Desulfobacterales bacterium]
MIGYLEGKLIHRDEERVMVLAGQVGYEVMLPGFVMATLADRPIGEGVAFYIYFHQTERQPRPVLIGFNSEAEKAFFLQFLSVEAIGPIKAVKALTLPVAEVARAIENKDAALLGRLKGIGGRTAQKIIATLSGKMAEFSLPGEETGVPSGIDSTARQVLDVMVNQLGHRLPEARKMIADALKRNGDIQTPEALFDEVYRGEAAHDR